MNADANRSPTPPQTSGAEFPFVDLHAHLTKGLSVGEMVRLAQERGVKLGIVEHAGAGQRIGDDEALSRYVEMLDPYPVYKGIQAEGQDWAADFSPSALARLDYVLSDALTYPDRGGRLVRLWTPEAQIGETNKSVQDFMDRYVNFNVRVMALDIDILANSTFLPAAIAHRYDELWTEERMRRVIAAAIRHHVAIEINARYRIPSATFIRLAKVEGVRFSFGSNEHGPGIAQLAYCQQMVEQCDLTRADLFSPEKK
jgi:hypothetical protein